MKNKKILYLLTIILTLFSFNMNVKATETLTCVYEKIPTKSKVAIVRDESYQFHIYFNSNDVGLNDSGWLENNQDYYLDDGTTEKENDGYSFNECPKSVEIIPKTKEEYGVIKLYPEYKETNDEERQNLEKDDSDTGIAPEINTETTVNPKTCSEYETNELIIRPFDQNSYIASCIYIYNVNEGAGKRKGCNVIQLDISSNNISTLIKSDVVSNATGGFNKDNDKVIEKIETEILGWCPSSLFVSEGDNNNPHFKFELEYVKDYKIYKLAHTQGKNLIDQSIEQKKDGGSFYVDKSKFKNFATCEEMLDDENSKKVLDLLRIIVNIVKIFIPILLIGLGMFDFAKAIFAGSDDKMKKAQSKFIKRVIVGICIFLIPSVLKLLLTIANGIWSNISADLCGIL